MTMTTTLPAGKAQTLKTTFSRTTNVSCTISAEAEVIWALLTHAADYPRWNPAVTQLKGTLAPGERIALQSPLAPGRTFKLKVKEFIVNQKMVWGDGKGSRTFLLEPNGTGGTRFTMSETIGGFMFPLYAKYIPSFDESFETFAAALKSEAEKIQHIN